MVKPTSLSGLALAAMLTACVTPDDVRGVPEDTWTWQVNQNYQQFAHCLADSLNSAPVHSWFYLAPPDHQFRAAMAGKSHYPEVD
jgi:hypothetical protein